MAVFNCAPFENENGVENENGFDLVVETQTDDIETGELSVEGSLKLKGINGVNVAISGDTVVLGIDPDMFPEYDAGGNSGASGDSTGGSSGGTDGGASGDSTGGSSGGGGSTSGSGCTCPNIYTANSVAELPDPATVPEDSIGFVPSSKDITLTSPNGTVYRITVSDDGTLAAEAV